MTNLNLERFGSIIGPNKVLFVGYKNRGETKGFGSDWGYYGSSRTCLMKGGVLNLWRGIDEPLQSLQREIEEARVCGYIGEIRIRRRCSSQRGITWFIGS